MADYGLTPKGPNIKRLDTILEDMHSGLSEKWGVNTRKNPESLLNHLLTNVADRLAELWEFGESVYFSQYPSSAEGASLDNAAQYGGTTRDPAAKSFYPIHCTGTEGTVIAIGTTISSTTNPATSLMNSEEKTLSRSAFNKVVIKVASVSIGSIYTVAINGTVYSFEAVAATAVSILNGLKSAITDAGFTTAVNTTDELLSIEAVDKTSSNTLVLSENLTTETVTNIISFGTVETGDILIPDGVITNIVKADAGLLSVTNLCGYVAGRDEESDSDFRESYADKIFNRSSMMLESIRSAILDNVQGVKSVAPYENDTNDTDAYGRPAHSIEIVVDGGEAMEIAKQILQKKAGGISTYGSTTVNVVGAYDEDIPISFNRPTALYTWFHIGVTLSTTETAPSNYAALLKEAIIENMDAIEAGEDVIPQQFMSQLYAACKGINYIDISLFTTDDAEVEPTTYTLRSAVVTARQRAYTTAEMIEVAINA